MRKSKCTEFERAVMNWMQQRTKNVSDQELLRMDDDIGTLRQGCSLGLDVSISRRSRDVVSKRLGLVSVLWKHGKVSVSISSRTENQMSRSRLGLVP